LKWTSFSWAQFLRISDDRPMDVSSIFWKY
jgi:hypothetical protein